MFNESWPWKRDLAAAADRLEGARLGFAHRLGKFGDDDDAYEQEAEAVYQVKRDVMSGAFAARRGPNAESWRTRPPVTSLWLRHEPDVLDSTV